MEGGRLTDAWCQGSLFMEWKEIYLAEKPQGGWVVELLLGPPTYTLEAAFDVWMGQENKWTI